MNKVKNFENACSITFYSKMNKLKINEQKASKHLKDAIERFLYFDDISRFTKENDSRSVVVNSSVQEIVLALLDIGLRVEDFNRKYNASSGYSTTSKVNAIIRADNGVDDLVVQLENGIKCIKNGKFLSEYYTEMLNDLIDIFSKNNHSMINHKLVSLDVDNSIKKLNMYIDNI